MYRVFFFNVLLGSLLGQFIYQGIDFKAPMRQLESENVYQAPTLMLDDAGEVLVPKALTTVGNTISK